jgi:phosphoglycerate dehydrogenase-like enzyme
MSDQSPLAVFVITHPWLKGSVREAAPASFGVEFVDANDTQAAVALIPRADFLVTTYLPSSWLPLLRRCRLVQLLGVGTDQVDVVGLQEAGIPVAITPDGLDVGVAEHTILFILALYKRFLEVSTSTRRGEWDEFGWRQQCHLFHGKTLGLVGFGRVGRQVAHLARAFDAQVIYFDPVPAGSAIERVLEAKLVSFRELLQLADIVSVHTPLNERTRLLFGAQAFSQMKRGSIFINTSRGGTYDLDALYDSIRSGHIAGAGLDVFEPEPPPATHPLLQLQNVLCTPHMAAGTLEVHHRKLSAQFANMRRVLHGEAPLNLLSPQ